MSNVVDVSVRSVLHVSNYTGNIAWYLQRLIDLMSHAVAVCKHIGWAVFDECVAQYADSMP